MLDHNSSLSKGKLKFGDVDEVSDECSIRILCKGVYKDLKYTLFCFSR